MAPVPQERMMIKGFKVGGRSMVVPGLVAAICLAAAVSGSAQSRDQMQMLADMRMLQEQVQTLRAVVGQLTDQNKAIMAKLDAQTDAARTQASNQMSMIRDLQTPVNALDERLNQNKLEIAKLTSELSSIREG